MNNLGVSIAEKRLERTPGLGNECELSREEFNSMWNGDLTETGFSPILHKNCTSYTTSNSTFSFILYTNSGISSWSTEDPAGYVDGLNLYAAYFDVNGVDATGLALFAFDGTNNDWASDTNVRRFYEQYNMPRSRKFYVPGIGKGRLEGTYNAAVGEGAGWRLNKYKVLLDQYLTNTPDDKFVDIVGFSRGAATARAFVNEIQDVLAKHGAQIRFIGAFDTVPAMGGKDNKGGGMLVSKEIDTDLPRGMGYESLAFHAMSIHETRSKFGLERYRGATERWFAGVHSNVGGGYPKDGLSNIALRWMLDNAISTGVPVSYSNSDFPTTKDNLKFYDEMKEKMFWNVPGWMWLLNSRIPRVVTGGTIDPSVLNYGGVFPKGITTSGIKR